MIYERVTNPAGRFGLRSVYVEHYWLPILGPTSWALLRRLDANLGRAASVRASDDVLARACGVGPGALRRTLTRLVSYHCLFPTGEDRMGLVDRLPVLRRTQLARMTDALIEAHPYFLQEESDAA